MKRRLFTLLMSTTVLFAGFVGTVHPQDAPSRAYMQGVRDRLVLEQARAFAAANERAATTRTIRAHLVLAYEAIGIDPTSATLLAAGYTFDNRTAPYIGLAFRVGAKQVVDQAITALERNDFDTCNRMLAAAYIVLHARQESAQ